MRNFLMSAMALTAVLVIPGVASANDVADRTQAISICRAEVQAQAGADASVRLDQVRVRLRTVRVDLDVWRDGALQNVRCDVERGHEQLTIASITPTLQTASLAR
ncbi:MAG: hypothetical protein NT015_01785 [Alphaproteobacteria bacterium]|nr:hypothetical protein [Alphaproteobacteria bacterium]